MSETRDAQQTILVVDHEPLMLHLAAAILHRAGYEVLRARSGAEALATFSSQQCEFSCCWPPW